MKKELILLSLCLLKTGGKVGVVEKINDWISFQFIKVSISQILLKVNFNNKEFIIPWRFDLQEKMWIMTDLSKIGLCTKLFYLLANPSEVIKSLKD